jgi:integrase
MAHIQKRRGRWQARVRGPDGRERTRTFRTKVEAESWLHAAETAKRKGEWIDTRAGKQRLTDWAARWLAGARPSLKPSTVSSYASLIQSRIDPVLGQYRLASLRPSDVQAWVNGMDAAGVSTSRIRQARVVLAQILDSAVQDGVLGRNVARGAKIPRLERHEARYFQPDVVDRIAAAMPTEYGYDVLVRLLGVVGLRFGEAVALRRRSIDLLARRVRVEESVTEVRGQLERGSPKSHATRAVPIPDSLARQLAAHLAARVDAGLDAPVFRGPKGGTLRYGWYYHRVWRPTLDRLGLNPVGVHALRHSAAARMIAAGASLKAIQTILGHGSAAFSLTVYGHLLPSDLDELAARLDVAARTFDGPTVVSTSDATTGEAT